jgi:hypothetical protein
MDAPIHNARLEHPLRIMSIRLNIYYFLLVLINPDVEIAKPINEHASPTAVASPFEVKIKAMPNKIMEIPKTIFSTFIPPSFIIKYHYSLI